MKLITALSIILLTAVSPQSMVQVAGGPELIEFNSHAVAACGQEPNQIEVRMQNLTIATVKVTGEIWAQEDGGEARLIAEVPPSYQELETGAWGGPEERLENAYPNGFVGQVWGWAEIRYMDGTLVGRTELARTAISCEPNQEPNEFNGHVMAVCDQEPDQVEVRMQSLMTDTVKVTGEIWAQKDEGEARLIAEVPIDQQELEPGIWGGPEERIQDVYPDGFVGQVWGWAEIRTLNGNLVGKTELASTAMNCEPEVSVPKLIFLPMISMPEDPSCSDLAMWVYPPNAPPTRKVFETTPGTIYGFGDAFVAGTTVRFVTDDKLPVNSSYLGWFNSYTRQTGTGPEWNFKATGFQGDPPLLATLYTWQAAKVLPDGTWCAIGFLLQWDPS